MNAIQVGRPFQYFERQIMIRPRTGDFKYTDQEVDVMIEDIRLCKTHGVRGVVVGLLDEDGRVDIEKTKR